MALKLAGVHLRLVSSLIAANLLLFAALPTHADTLRTQQIQLQKGWNAVFLEVYPTDAAPGVVFTDTPIDMAASYYERSSSAQFITDPGAKLFKKAGWGVWYAETRPDAFLKTLHAVYGQQAYLIHAKSDYTWNITGAVVPPEVRWQPAAYNLVGFSLSAQSPPTFNQFFAGSKAHQHNQIYRLANGSWRRVLDPTAETMRSGEAFWVFCDGVSKYQGPLRVETATRSGIVLGARTDVLTLRNESNHPVTPTLDHVVSGADSVPLSIVIRATGDETMPIRSISAAKPEGQWTQLMPALEAAKSIQVPLEARAQDLKSMVQSSLLKISTDLGTEIWIPVVSTREDLKESKP